MQIKHIWATSRCSCSCFLLGYNCKLRKCNGKAQYIASYILIIKNSESTNVPHPTYKVFAHTTYVKWPTECTQLVSYDLES